MSPAVSEFRRPESVLVVVYTRDADVLLLERIRPFSFWQSVTGSLFDGESHAAAAARELHEETGIRDARGLSFSGNTRVFTIDKRWRHRFAPGTVENTEFEWRLRLDERVDIAIDPTEHSNYRWLPIDDAIDEVWSWTNKEALQELRAEL